MAPKLVMEKTAFPGIGAVAAHALPHMALFGTAGHAAVNAAGMTAHKGNIADILAHHGLQHGLTGASMNPAARFSLTHMMGPETIASYDTARAIGEKLKGLPTDEMHGILAAGVASGHIAPGLSGAPILGSLQRAAAHEVAGTAPELENSSLVGRLHGKLVGHLAGNARPDEFKTTATRVADTAKGGWLPAAYFAADPLGAATHAAVNETRRRIGMSETGARFSTNLMQQGMRGEMPSKARQFAYNIGLSPAVMDMHRLGLAARTGATEAYGPGGQKFVDTLGHARFEDIKHVADQAKATLAGQPPPAMPHGKLVPGSSVVPQALQPRAPQPQGAVAPNWRSLGAVGLGGGGLYAATQPSQQKAAAAAQGPQQGSPGYDAQMAGAKARAALRAYTNPLSSLVTLALLSNAKTAAVSAVSFASEMYRQAEAL